MNIAASQQYSYALGHSELELERLAQQAQLFVPFTRQLFEQAFLLHLLPKGFVRIRHFGFLASRHRAQLLPRCFAALDSEPAQTKTATSAAQDMTPNSSCPQCGGPMVIIERLTAAEIQLRSPPKVSMATA
jgi:putative transposase